MAWQYFAVGEALNAATIRHIIGDGGFQGHLQDPKFILENIFRFPALYRNATGRNLGSIDQIEAYLPRLLFSRVYQEDGDALVQNMTGPATMVVKYWFDPARDIAPELFACLYPTISSDLQPAMHALWNQHLGVSDAEIAKKVLKDNLGAIRHQLDWDALDLHTVFAFVNYPLEQQPGTLAEMPHTWHASVVQPDGTFVVAGDRQDPSLLPALTVYDLVGGSYGGSVMRIEPNTGMILSITQVPGVVLAMDITPDGDLLLASNNGSMGLSGDGKTLQWKAGSSDEIASDGAGGAWFSTRKGKQVTHVDKTCKVLHSFKAGAGFGIHSMTYLVEQKLVVVGGAISRPGPIHVPYIHAHRHDDSMAWKMNDFPGKASVNAGDIADTLVVKMAVGPDGSLYAVAHSDGGATMWRHHPQKLGVKLPNVPIGHQGNQMYLAKHSNHILCLAKIDPTVGMPQKIAYVTSWSHSKDKPNDKVASDQQAFGIAISPSGRLAISGVSRGHIPWTKNAVHKESIPIETIGLYNNPMAADEAFFIILDKELQKAEIFTGLGRNKAFPSQAKAIALTDEHLLVGGYVKSPAGTSIGQTAWTKNAWSTTSGGGKDALFALFGGKESRIDGLPSKQLATYAKFALPQGESLPANLGDALADEASMAAKLVTMVGTQAINQAQGLADAGLIADSEAILADLTKRFANTPWGEQATAAQTALQADPHYKLNKDISGDIADYYKAADRLREVRGAEVSALDMLYYKRNASSVRKMGKIAKDLQDLPEGLGDGVAAKAQELISNARAYGMALSKEEEKAFKSYHLCIGLTTRLKIKGKEKPLWSNKNFRKRNERVLVQMRVMLEEIIAMDLDHPITQAAKDVRDRYGLGGKK